jgi:hypothetical protein
MLGAVLQAQLLGVLRTGNPVVDALLTTIIVSLLSTIAVHKGTIISWIKKLWIPAVAAHENSISTIIINEYDENMTANQYYNIMMWYMTYKVPTPNGGEAVLSKSIQTGKESFITSKKYDVTFEDHKITIFKTHDVDKDGNIVRKRIIVTSDGNVMPVIRKFIDDIQQQSKTSTWKQTMHYRSRSGAWVTRYTHSTKTFASVVLKTEIKNQIISDFRNFLSAEKWYASMGLSYKRGYLFHGPPGSGKTSMVLAMSNESTRPIYRLDLSKIDSDDALETAFVTMPDNCMVVLEDVDCASIVTHARNSPSSASSSPESLSYRSTFTLSALLNHLDGVGSNHGRIFVMTSNHPELLDPALIRPGRVDMSIYMGRCCTDQMSQFYRLYFGDDAEEDERLAEVPEDVLTPAEVASVFQHHRNDPRSAVAELANSANGRAASCVVPFSISSSE